MYSIKLFFNHDLTLGEEFTDPSHIMYISHYERSPFYEYMNVSTI